MKSVPCQVDDMDKENADKELADTDEVQLSKLQISEQRKTEKLREKLGLIVANTANKEYCLYIHAKPIPHDVIALLESHDHLINIVKYISKDVAERGNAIGNLRYIFS